jgi:hypothetical protein
VNNDEVLERGGITDQLGLDLAGLGFRLAILLGVIIIGESAICNTIGFDRI